MSVYGYVRVSSKDQNEDRQYAALRQCGVAQKNIVIDKQTGKNFDRPGYQKLMKKIKPGDTLMIQSIDRFGRDYHEILKQWRLLTREKGVYLVVLDMPLLDTRQGRDLSGTLIADITLQLLSYVAQTEREMIRRRQKEGIAAAKARGVQFGRKPKQPPAQFKAYRQAWQCGSISARSAAQALGVSHKTFLKWTRSMPG